MNIIIHCFSGNVGPMCIVQYFRISSSMSFWHLVNN